MVSEKVLVVENLKVYFPIRRTLMDIIKRRPRKYVRAVDGISFFINRGEFFCLVGESGCGKTTTAKAILRLVEPLEGRILFKPKQETLEEVKRILGPELNKYMYEGFVDVTKLPDKAMRVLRRDMQMVHQDPYGSLNPRYKVKQILEEPLIVHGVKDPSVRLKIVKEALEAVKLVPPDDFMHRYPHQLSGGQRQRVAIARALVLKPQLIAADEPVSMLDVSIRAEILELMKTLQRDLGISFLFITHNLATARHVCDRVAVMYLGRIVEEGPTDEVILKPLHPYTRALVAAIPEPEPKNRFRLKEVPIKGEIPSPVDLPKGCRFFPRCVEADKHPEIRKRCMESEPPLITLENEHKVACWLLKR